MRHLSVLALALLAGCSLFTGELAPLVDGAVVFSLPVLDFDGEGPDAPQRRLIVRTEASYNCLFPLEADLDVDGSHLTLGIEGLADVDACLAAIGPARADFPLALADGIYTLQLSHLGHIDRYRIVLEGDGARVEALEAVVSRYEVGAGWPD